MMYGFGDAAEPLGESIDLMEDAVVNFVQETVRFRLIFEAQKSWKVQTRPGKMSVEDVLFVIRKDKKKYARAVELLRKVGKS